MQVRIKIDYHLGEGGAPSSVELQQGNMRKIFRIKKRDYGIEVEISPYLGGHKEDIEALIKVLQGADHTLIGIGLLIESVFLTGVQIGKTQKG